MQQDRTERRDVETADVAGQVVDVSVDDLGTRAVHAVQVPPRVREVADDLGVIAPQLARLETGCRQQVDADVPARVERNDVRALLLHPERQMPRRRAEL